MTEIILPPEPIEIPEVAPVATQVQYPWQATLRTVFATLAGGIIAFSALIATLTIFAPQFVAAITPALPEAWAAYVTAGLATFVTFAGAVTRVMAIPGVNTWLHKIKLGTTPKGK